jgi:hypothetical protein
MDAVKEETTDHDMQRLIDEADALDEEQGRGEPVADSDAPGAAAAAPELTQADQISGIAQTFGAILALRFPSLRNVLTREKCDELGRVLEPIFVRMGWTIEGGDIAEYIAAAAVIFPLAADVKAAIVHDLDEERKKAATQPAAEVQHVADPSQPIQESLYKEAA